ncbi:MAG: tRNA pseudouridine(38-40) synthase TruA [bacterium]|nr:tRNA pseudouridine(38-40) synthase TruA [bacterium]
MSNIKLTLEYDGTNYSGWQKQPNFRTIGGIIEEKLSKICNEKINVVSAGRTDSGVHGLGQVINFKTNSSLRAKEIKRALNRILPKDIVILRAEEVSRRFNARFSAISRTYQYLILNQDMPSAFNRDYVWWIKDKLNLRRIKVASKYFLGKHNFSLFSVNAKEVKSYQREIKDINISRRENMIKFLITANAFLPRMVRGIIGVLVNIGKGEITLQEVKEMLEGKKIRNVSFAPASGVYLLKVEYKDNK